MEIHLLRENIARMPFRENIARMPFRENICCMEICIFFRVLKKC